MECFWQKGYKSSHISELCSTTASTHMNITYDYHIKQPKLVLEYTSSRKHEESSQHRNALDMSSFHPLNRK